METNNLDTELPNEGDLTFASMLTIDQSKSDILNDTAEEKDYKEAEYDGKNENFGFCYELKLIF